MQWYLLLGIATGMRSMTGMAVMCWFAYLGRTPVHGWAFWAGNLVSAIVFGLFALGEYIGDTLPKCPNRTDPGPAIARLVFGGLVGALAANATHEPLAGGILFGVAGAVIGTWGGIRVRALLAKLAGRDLPAALLESAIALAVAWFSAAKLAEDVTLHSGWWK